MLDDQPGVMESAVIGVPHKDFGETVLAVVVAGAGSGPDVDQLQSACAKQLARFKHPRKIVLVDALPRNTMGKVQKNLLRDEYQNAFAEG